MSPSLGIQTLVISGSVLASIITMAVVPALPGLSEFLGGGASGSLTAQLVMTAPAISFACAAPCTAWLAARYGLRFCLIVALLLFVVSGLLPCVLHDMPSMVVSRTLLGIAGGMISTLTLSLAGDVTGPDRDRLLGYTHAGGGGAAIAALLMGGLLVQTWGWRAPFGLFALGLPILVVALFSLPVPAASLNMSEPDIRTIPQPRIPKENRVLNRVGRLWSIYAMLFVMSVGFFVPALEGPFLLGTRSIDSPLAQSVCLSAMPVTSLLVSLFYGGARQHLDEQGLSVVTLWCTGLGLCLAGMSAAAWSITLGFALTGVGAGLAVPVVAAILIARTTDDADLQSTALGIYFTVMFAAQFSTPLLIEPFKREVGSAGAFVCLGAVALACALLSMTRSSRVAIHGSD